VSTSTKHRSIAIDPAPGLSADEPFFPFDTAAVLLSRGYSRSASKGTPHPPQKMTSPVNRWDSNGGGVGVGHGEDGDDGRNNCRNGNDDADDGPPPASSPLGTPTTPGAGRFLSA
jgi:hypothetical protein